MDITTLAMITAAAVVVVILLVILAAVRSAVREMRSGYSESAERQISQLDRQGEQIDEINRQLINTMNQVSRSLGELRNLTSGVEDLKRVMSNVKTRGIVGELQLGAILEEILAPDQYDINVPVNGSSERVEYAVKFPAEDGGSVYLPIDSKFPADAYLNLLDAYDTGDKAAIKKASDGLKYAIIKAAKDIKSKYICPPHTTEFGIMFLPFEGLYAEVLRLGLVETLQNGYHVNIAGPTTMAAMLSSFRLGFKSLALQQSSGEVWDTLEKVKTEFAKFSEALISTQRKLEQAQSELENLIGVRTRGIQKALDKVSGTSENR